MANKKNGKIKIQEEREKRQSQLVAVQQEKRAVEQRLSQLNVMELKIIGALEQLDELEGPSRASGQAPALSKDGAPKEDLEKSRRVRDSAPPKAGEED